MTIGKIIQPTKKAEEPNVEAYRFVRLLNMPVIKLHPAAAIATVANFD